MYAYMEWSVIQARRARTSRAWNQIWRTEFLASRTKERRKEGRVDERKGKEEQGTYHAQT